jgi:hypothetical protein
METKPGGTGLIDAGVMMRRKLTKLLGKAIPKYGSMMRE